MLESELEKKGETHDKNLIEGVVVDESISSDAGEVTSHRLKEVLTTRHPRQLAEANVAPVVERVAIR